MSVRTLKWKKIIFALYAFSFLGFLFPDYEWDSETVYVEGETGENLATSMTAEEIGNAVYESEEIVYTFGLFDFQDIAEMKVMTDVVRFDYFWKRTAG